MEEPKLIIITGLPCSGKTHLARNLSEKFSIPVFSKDVIKETLFDSLGWKDREWSKKLGLASYPLLYSIVEEMLKARKSLIIESNFSPSYDDEIFIKLKEKYSFFPIIIYCEANGEVLFERFKARSLSLQRHPGHRDEGNGNEFKELLLKGVAPQLSMEAKKFHLDTTNITNIDLTEIDQLFDTYFNKGCS